MIEEKREMKKDKTAKNSNTIPNAFIFSVEKGMPFQTRKEGLSACQEPPVKDRWHEFAAHRVVLEHTQNSTSGSNQSSKMSGILMFKELERANAVLQRLARRIEKRFHDVVWYIGTDIFADGIYERFVFNKGGFMEIRIGNNAGIYAYFDTEKRAKEFRRALENAMGDIKC